MTDQPQSSAALPSMPCSQLNLIFKAERLKRKDILTKSDPVCILYQLVGRIEGSKPIGNAKWKEVGRTERIRNSSDPEWARQIPIDYFFEERQTLRFEIYDWDTEALDTPLNEHDFLGSMMCDLAEIVSAGIFTRGLGETGRAGTLTITCEEVDDGCRETFIMDLSAEKLDKKDWGLFGKSDPYIQIYRVSDAGSKTMVHRTEYIKKDLNPTWKQFEINLKTLCGGDKTKAVYVECWDNDDESLSDHDFIGSCQLTAEEMLQNPELKKPLINQKKAAKKRNYLNSGVLKLRTKMIMIPTFLDFIHGGTQLDFSVAVDFTASNGAVRKPSSLHFISEAKPNQYEIAIKAVLEICQHYNNSKIFDAYGFGARLSLDSKMLPIFSLNDPKPILKNPAVVGVEGVMRAYRHCLNNVHLHGPTHFAPIINQAMSATARKVKQDGSRYHILLIITDGAITDMEQTKRSIIDAAGLPLSIIIIGVGTENFEKMDELDGDNQRITSGGRVAERDIVQFVPVKRFLPESKEIASDMLMAKLAKEILAEVPVQLTSYMRRHNIMPRPADDPWPRDPCAIPQYDPPFIAPTGPPGNAYQYPTNNYPIQGQIGFHVSQANQPYPPQGPAHNGGTPYPQQAPYHPPSQSGPYPPQNGPSSVSYLPGGNLPYPPQPGYQGSQDGHSFPYGIAPYPQDSSNQQNYNYPTYPQPHQNGHPNQIPLTVPYGAASAPPVSVDDVQMSFSNMDMSGQNTGYPPGHAPYPLSNYRQH